MRDDRSGFARAYARRLGGNARAAMLLVLAVICLAVCIGVRYG